MPPRIARSTTQGSSTRGGKNKARKRNLNAYSIASHSTKEKKGLPRHRLGEIVEEGLTAKRRRNNENEDDLSDEEDQPRKSARKRGPNEDDGIEYGSDSEGNEWTLGGLAEDDEDSDLDSDEAFGESDEEKFEGFTFRGSSSNKSVKKRKKSIMARPKATDINLDEGEEDTSEEGEEDDFSDEGVDLATMLDKHDAATRGNDDITAENLSVGSASDEDEDDGGEADESQESSAEDATEDEAGDEERVARLRDRLENLDDKPSATAPMTLDTAVSVDDLLADLDPAARAQYAAALKTKKKSTKPTTLSAPLPKRQQDKLDREVATKKAKGQLDRWRDTVMHNRRAEHLTFPLHDPNQSTKFGKEKFIQNGQPQNELEENILKIMEESGIATRPDQAVDDDAEATLVKSEELATNTLPVEEVMRRRAELRRTRELLFREEIKAKRIAKIKSKSYRRVHRKERERQEQKEREMLDPEGLGLPMDEDEREMLDRKRAEERMSTKHRESKWAKSMKATNRTIWDEGARNSVHEQARRNEELKRRIAGQQVGEDESDVPSDSDDFDDDNDDDDGQHALRRLGQLNTEGEGKDQGLASMKFMKAADAKRKAQNDDNVAQMRKELGIEDGDDTDSGAEIDDQGLGRAVFGPKGKGSGAKRLKPKRPEMEEGASSEGEIGPDVHEEVVSNNGGSKKPSKRSEAKSSERLSGPLAKGQVSEHGHHGDTAQDLGLAWLSGPGAKKSKKDRQRDRTADVDTLIVTQPSVGQKGDTFEAGRKAESAKASIKLTTTNGRTTIPLSKTASDDSASDSDPEVTDPILTAAQHKASYHARAFAGDDAHVTDFSAEKDAAIVSEDDQETSTHLPGWGSWAGNGLTKSIRKANARQKHNPLWKTKTVGGIKAADRQDRDLTNVIISEKKPRKGSKYLAPVLPHEFEKREQYERSLRIPVGPEWTTKETFQRNTRPRVVVKQGIVAPMERPII